MSFNSSKAVACIFKKIGSRPAVLATGFICRQAQAAAPRGGNFYMIGSMGMASSIGLGAALAKPKQPIVVIDGDGAVLMNLGHLPMAGAFGPKNFYHIVIDNGRYESTGGQASLAADIKLEDIAKASGYRSAKRVATESALSSALTRFFKSPGPAFLLVKVKPESSEAPPRVADSPEEITRKFSAALQSGK
jgi:thiamine pyrophosphate-dependent acetolactate synthase large subunit-like protein